MIQAERLGSFAPDTCDIGEGESLIHSPFRPMFVLILPIGYGKIVVELSNQTQWEYEFGRRLGLPTHLWGFPEATSIG
jgi:hypothetical protein